jgi:hypothetical protein
MLLGGATYRPSSSFLVAQQLLAHTAHQAAFAPFRYRRIAPGCWLLTSDGLPRGGVASCEIGLAAGCWLLAACCMRPPAPHQHQRQACGMPACRSILYHNTKAPTTNQPAQYLQTCKPGSSQCAVLQPTPLWCAYICWQPQAAYKQDRVRMVRCSALPLPLPPPPPLPATATAAGWGLGHSQG